jgi:DNA modification methylase
MIDIRLSDNLELMAEIEDNTVDLIYCDILYGTGRKFKDYQDLKHKREIIEEHYIPRIKEMHRILKDTGSIYLQMDTKINHWLRCILDDVFGYDNFRNEIIWCYSGGGVPKKDFAQKHDCILRYSKTKDYTFNLDAVRDDYSDDVKNSNPSRYDKSYRKNGVYSGYKPNPLGKHPNDWWKIQQLMPSDKKERVDYATQKPKALIERIIKASSNKNDLVSDFYAGSFTTAEVCKDLNRNFIGCDISEKAVSIGLERTKY